MTEASNALLIFQVFNDGLQNLSNKTIYFQKPLKYTDIEIIYSSSGKPFPIINKTYDSNLQISISHCGDIVISNCILFKT